MFGQDAVSESETRTVHVGEDFSITLISNPTTGYQWRLSAQPDPAVVKSLGMKFEKPPEKGLLGAPGKETWTFHAEGPGEVAIQLEYVRPWEKGKLPARTRLLNVTVEQ